MREQMNLARQGEEATRKFAHPLNGFILHLREEVGEGETGARFLDERARTKKELIRIKQKRRHLKYKRRRRVTARAGRGQGAGRSACETIPESRFQ